MLVCDETKEPIMTLAKVNVVDEIMPNEAFLLNTKVRLKFLNFQALVLYLKFGREKFL